MSDLTRSDVRHALALLFCCASDDHMFEILHDSGADVIVMAAMAALNAKLDSVVTEPPPAATGKAA